MDIRSVVNYFLRKVFGFRIYYCSQCLVEINTVYYPEEKKDEETNEITHTCKTEHIIAANAISFEKCRELNNDVIDTVKKFLVASGSFKNILAVSLDSHSQEKIELRNPVNLAIPITFSFSKEKCIEVDLDGMDQASSNDAGNNNNNNNYNHFLARVLSKGQAELAEDELSEFLKIVKTATFGFFRVKMKGSLHNYFITLNNSLMHVDDS